MFCKDCAVGESIEAVVEGFEKLVGVEFLLDDLSEDGEKLCDSVRIVQHEIGLVAYEFDLS